MKMSSIKVLVKGLVGVAMCLYALGVFAAEMEQVAYGIKWTYLVSNGKAIITRNSEWVEEPESPVAIKIPSKLGGCPVEKIRKGALHNLDDENVRQLIISEGITTIDGELGLDGESEITSIYLPKTLRVIGPRAFCDAFKGTQLTLPEGLERIGEEAFQECENMTSIKIPDSVKDIGEGAFSFCSIKTANIPKQIKVVPRDLFSYNAELEDITLHDDITEIGDYAFHHSTTHLKSIKLPRRLKKIGAFAFQGAKQLEQIEIPNGVTSIGKYAFEGCPALETLSIPENVNTIGEGAFAGWDNLTSVTMPAVFKSGIRDIFAYPYDSVYFRGGHDVPTNDIFTFTEPSAHSSAVNSGKTSPVDSNR